MLWSSDVGLLLGGRIHEELGKDVQPALDTALSMTGSTSLTFVFIFFLSLLSPFLGKLFIVIYHISHENIMLIYNTLVSVVSYFTVLSLICQSKWRKPLKVKQ